MSVAFFLMSTGRCSTQFLAQAFAEAAPDCLVEHEPIRYEYMPRKVFRQKEFKKNLGGNVVLQRKLIQIEDTLADNIRYVDVGWPTYAWLPYLSSRFQERFEFSHLVRNPFYCSASMVTQRVHSGGGANYVRTAMIHADDPKVKYPEFADSFQRFSPFEKCLYHWLELNDFLLEFREHAAFRGIYRFEDLYSSSSTALDDLATVVLGRNVGIPVKEAYDRVHRKLPVPLKISDHKLIDAVAELAMKLGYSERELENSFDLDVINETYSMSRLQK